MVEFHSKFIAVLLIVGLVAGNVAAAPASPIDTDNFTPGSQLQQLVDNAIHKGLPSVILPSGNFLFSNSSLTVVNATGLVVQGAGVAATQLWFEPGYGLFVSNSVDTSVGGLSTDLTTPPNSQGKLVSLDVAKQSLVLDIESGFPLPDDPFFDQGEVKVIYWDPATRKIIQGQQMNSPVASTTCHDRRCTVVTKSPIRWLPPANSLVSRCK